MVKIYVTPKQRFDASEKILKELSNLDADYLLGNVPEKTYHNKRLKLKLKFRRI